MADAPPKLKVALVSSGEGNAFRFLHRLCSCGIVNAEIIAVLTDRDCGFVKYAEDNNIPVLSYIAERREHSLSVSDKLYALLKNSSFEPDIICLAYDRLILGDFLKEFKNRLINCHPGLLPSFKGFKAIEQTLSSAVSFGGCSIHLCNEGVDDGAIIWQAVISLTPSTSQAEYGKILFKHMKCGLAQVVQWFAENRVDIFDGKVVIRDAEYGKIPHNPSFEIFG